MKSVAVTIALLLTLVVTGCDGQSRALVGDPPLSSNAQTRLGPIPYVSDPNICSPRPVRTQDTRYEETVFNAPARQQPVPEAWVAGNPGRWQYIILHHSATDGGNADVYDRSHRRRGWDELGYHFVITNGKGGSNGKVEVGPRWAKQKHGAHCRVDPNDDNRWNMHGIGICLVGNFNKRPPSNAQVESAARLVAALMDQCNIPRSRIHGHGQVPGAKTDCPGKGFPYARLFRRVAAIRGR